MSDIKSKRQSRQAEEHGGGNCSLANNSGELFVNSGRVEAQPSRAADRRVARTQKLLRDALHSLIREKDYDSIVVKEILNRANVGRSAFYTHFRDKDELLTSSIHEMLGSVPPIRLQTGLDRLDRALWFSLPILEYHDRHRRASTLKIGPRGQAILHGHLQNILGERITRELRKDLRTTGRSATGIPAGLLAQYLAATFVLVLNWWLDGNHSLSARQANEIFRSLVLPKL
jgi:AcrR family transcriptional regulator